MKQLDLLPESTPPFKNKAEEKCVTLIAAITKLMEEIISIDIIPLDQYEIHYKRLRGIKGFYDGLSWDKIGEDIKEDWFVNARKDKEFKKYYKLRAEFDKMEVLAK